MIEFALKLLKNSSNNLLEEWILVIKDNLVLKYNIFWVYSDNEHKFIQ